MKKSWTNIIFKKKRKKKNHNNWSGESNFFTFIPRIAKKQGQRIIDPFFISQSKQAPPPIRL